MKVLIVGDQHFRLELPYSAAFKDGRRGEWEKVLKTIHKTAKDCEAVVLMGDNMNTRVNHPTVIRQFIGFLKGFGEKDVHILVGNHERYGESTALDFLEKIDFPTWHVYTEIKNDVDLCGKKATFAPYLTPAMVEAEDEESGSHEALTRLTGGDLLFAHQGITGAKTSGTIVDLFKEIVFSKAALEKKYERIFTGHIHTSQRLSDKTLLTGSIQTMEVGEHGKSVWVLDTKNMSVEEVPLPVRGIYHFENPDIENMKAPPKDSIVKVTITKKEIDVEDVRKWLKKFDAGIVVEKYPKEREKVHFEEGALDLSIDNLLKVFAETRGVEYNELKDALRLLDS